MDPIFLLLVSTCYCHFLSTRIPKGIPRVFSVLPIFYLFSILPWHFSSAFLRFLSSLFITWISSFKLLLFCFDRGPLITLKNYIDFFAISILPLKIRDETLTIPPFLIVGLALLPLLLNNYIIFLFSFSIFLRFYAVWTGCGAIFARYEFVPIFKQPYLATSLQDFWGRRWNRMSSSILRMTIYDPTRDAMMGVMGLGKAKILAMLTTLAVSGVMHELMFYYITCGARPTWDVTWFFLLHGVCMGIEAMFRAKGWAPFHPVGSRLLTVGFVVVTTYWLIILPTWRSGRNRCDKNLRD